MVQQAESELGAENPEMSKPYYDLGMAYKKEHKFDLALEFLSKSYTLGKELLGEHNLTIAHICSQLAHCMIEAYNFEGAKQKLQEAIEIEKQNGRGDSDSSLVHYCDLAFLYLNTGDLQKAYDELLQAKPMIDSREPNWLTASFYSKFSYINRYFGNVKAAGHAVRKSFEIVSKPGFNKPDILNEVKGELALVNLSEGNHDQAEKLMREVIKDRFEFLQAEDVVLVKFKNYLGMILKAANKLEEAISAFKDSIETCVRLNLKNSMMCGAVYNNLGGAQSEANQLEDALNSHMTALNILKKTSGEDHEEAASNYDKIANVYYKQGRFDKTLECSEKSLHIRNKIYGENDPRTGNSYINAGMCHHLLRNVDKSCAYLEKGVNILKPLASSDPKVQESVAGALTNLAMIYLRRDDPVKAESTMLECIDIKKNLFGGETHPSIADSYLELAMIYEHQGSSPKALEMLEKAHEIASTTVGPKHPLSLEILDLKGVCFKSLQKFEEALKIHHQCLQAKQEAYGDDKQTMATAHQILGMTYFSMKDYDNALKYYKEGTDIYASDLKTVNRSLASFWVSLADIHKARGDKQQEKEYLEKALEFFRLKSGETGDNTQKIKDRLNSL